LEHQNLSNVLSLIKAIARKLLCGKEPNAILRDAVVCSSSTLKESGLSDNGNVPAYGAAGLSGYTDSCLVDQNSILITKDGSGVGSLQFVYGRHSFVGTLNSMTPRDGFYLPYIYYMLINVNFDTYVTGQAIPHIYFKDYGREAIYCPNYDEQVKIAKGLELIDKKLEAEKAMLYKFRVVKKYLLIKLFI
jgi:type I restriction enzyme S subunit